MSVYEIESAPVFIVAEFYQTQYGLIFQWQTREAAQLIVVVTMPEEAQ